MTSMNFTNTFKDTKKMAIEMINNQLNNFKLEYLVQWEENHSTTRELLELKIEASNQKKMEVENIFNDIKSLDSINFSLELMKFQEPKF